MSGAPQPVPAKVAAWRALYLAGEAERLAGHVPLVRPVPPKLAAALMAGIDPEACGCRFCGLVLTALAA